MGEDRILGEPSPKGLMHFCFDTWDTRTVALICPKKDLEKPLSKCCSSNEVLSINIEHSTFDCIANSESKSADWTIPINGHLLSLIHI